LSLPRSQATTSTLRRRRAAVLLFSYYPADNRPRRAAEALANEGMDVELICLRKSRDEAAHEVVNGVAVTRLPLRRHRGGAGAYVLQYSAFLISAFLLLLVRSCTRRFDLVHVHNMPDFLVFAAVVPKLLGAKVVLDLHDPMPELMMTIFGLGPTSAAVRLLEHLERWSIRFADLVFTVNTACKRIFASRSCPAEKIHIVMNSPDEEIFTPRPASGPRAAPGRRFVMMYHGSILERNGLDLAVEALTKIRATVPAAELRIYGEATPFLERVLGRVRDQGLQDVVRYFGAKGPKQVAAAIDDCDVGIIPNRRSIFTEINTPTRIFEYLSRGKAVITGRAPGVLDYFGEEDLYFFTLGDASDLARVMAHVSRHPAEVETVVKRGQDIYAAHRWGEERRQLLDRLAHLLSPATRPGYRDHMVGIER
jgi:glycosyltransferase involved in cell wall biosynthesis